MVCRPQPRTAYDALTDAQKALVTNYDVLTTAESTYADERSTYIVGVELIDNGDGTWTLVKMPNFDIELVVEYDDGTTAIISIKDGKVDSISFYDFIGRKVPSPLKPLYPKGL